MLLLLVGKSKAPRLVVDTAQVLLSAGGVACSDFVVVEVVVSPFAVVVRELCGFLMLAKTSSSGSS